MRLKDSPTLIGLLAAGMMLYGCGGGSGGSGSDPSSSLDSTEAAVANLQGGMGTATLSWTPPTRNNDGSYLSDLAGYRIYYGDASRDYPLVEEVGSHLAEYTVDGLVSGIQYFFAVTAVNSEGAESAYSNEVTKVIP